MKLAGSTLQEAGYQERGLDNEADQEQRLRTPRRNQKEEAPGEGDVLMFNIQNGRKNKKLIFGDSPTPITPKVFLSTIDLRFLIFPRLNSL